MKKSSIFLCFIFITLLLGFIAYGEDRYEYVCKGVNESMFYLDKSSITRTNTPNVFRCWYKDVVSDLERQHYIKHYTASRSNSNIKRKLHQLSYVMYCFEINLEQNTYKSIEEYTYDFSGNLIDKGISSQNVWEKIPHNSVMESMRNAIKRLTQNNIAGIPNANSIIFTALIVGITISALVVYLYAKLTSPTHVDTTTIEGVRKKYEDTSFNSNETKYDFEYPYEDIGKVTGM